MKDWFMEFDSLLSAEEGAMEGIIGAGSSSSEKALAHYRYQYRSSVRDAVEDTYPALKKIMGEKWEDVWMLFWKDYKNSPRSLDFVSEKFLVFILETQEASHLKELARFEYYLETHSWTHKEAPYVPVEGLTAETKLELHPLRIESFKAPVTLLYDEEEVPDLKAQEKVILWLQNDQTYFRSLKEWEIEVLENLSLGLGEALTYAAGDEDEVQEYFQWLGKTNLILKLS